MEGCVKKVPDLQIKSEHGSGDGDYGNNNRKGSIIKQ
jgi:hypothetical protein